MTTTVSFSRKQWPPLTRAYWIFAFSNTLEEAVKMFCWELENVLPGGIVLVRKVAPGITISDFEIIA